MTIALATPPNSDAYTIADNIRHLHRMSNTTRAQLLEAIARFDDLGLAANFGATSTASWLARDLRLSHSTAYEYTNVARALQRFPELNNAFTKGELDYTTVRYLTRYITKENESELVNLAINVCFAELQRALAGLDTDTDKDPDEPFFTVYRRADGMVVGEFCLPAVVGEQLHAALKLAHQANYDVDEHPDEADSADDTCTVGTKPAHPLGPHPDIAEVCPSTQTHPAGPTTKLSMKRVLNPPSRYGPPLKDDMYAAFISMITMVRANPTRPVRSPGADVTIMLTEDGKAWMPTNPQAPSRVLQNYVANATVRAHLLDGQGLTLYVGRSQRFATDGQIRALLAVWGHQCAMPGCAHSRFIEIHHMHDWADGGTTDLDNLIPLCSSCHSKVSHGLAHIERHGPNIEFTFLDGSRYISRNRGLPTVASPAPVVVNQGPNLSFDD